MVEEKDAEESYVKSKKKLPAASQTEEAEEEKEDLEIDDKSQDEEASSSQTEEDGKGEQKDQEDERKDAEKDEEKDEEESDVKSKKKLTASYKLKSKKKLAAPQKEEDALIELTDDSEDAPEVSQDPMANGFPKKVAPKHDVDHDAINMKKTKMPVKGLPEESSYENHKTQTADWRNEYKWSTEAPSPALAQSGTVRALPLTAALASCLF